MPLKLNLGAKGEIDVGSHLAELISGHRRVEGHVNQLRRSVAELAVQSPVHRDFGAHAVAAATAATYTFMRFDFGGPGGGVPAGWRFDLRQLSIFGTDPFTTATGVTAVAFKSFSDYVDSSNAPLGIHTLTVAAQVPNTAEWGSREACLLPLQQLWVCFKGLANNQDVSGFCQVDMVLEGAPLREIDETAKQLADDVKDGQIQNQSEIQPGAQVATSR